MPAPVFHRSEQQAKQKNCDLYYSATVTREFYSRKRRVEFRRQMARRVRSRSTPRNSVRRGRSDATIPYRDRRRPFAGRIGTTFHFFFPTFFFPPPPRAQRGYYYYYSIIITTRRAVSRTYTIKMAERYQHHNNTRTTVSLTLRIFVYDNIVREILLPMRDPTY